MPSISNAVVSNSIIVEIRSLKVFYYDLFLCSYIYPDNTPNRFYYRILGKSMGK